MHSQEEVIFAVYNMDRRDLLDLLMKHPCYMTDAYFTRIRQAIVSRYQSLIAEDKQLRF